MNAAIELRILDFLQKPDEREFESIALAIYAYQREQNPAYSRYCKFLGQSEPVVSWKGIPAVPQQAFKRAELRSFPASETVIEFRTSGTTGEGFGRHFMRSVRLYEASVQGGWDYFRLPRHPLLLLMPHPAVARYSSLSRMGSILTNDRNDAFFLDGNGALQVDRLRKIVSESGGPFTLFGPALAFVNLLEVIAELPLPPGSILMETGGFKGTNREIGKADLYSRLSECFHLDFDSIWNEYGMTELSSQFYSNGLGSAHLAPPWLRFMIVDPKTNSEAATGEVGLLRIFDLANLWSVLAIQTQDLAVAQDGAGFLLLGRDPEALPRGCSRPIDELIRRYISTKRETSGSIANSNAVGGPC